MNDHPATLQKQLPREDFSGLHGLRHLRVSIAKVGGQEKAIFKGDLKGHPDLQAHFSVVNGQPVFEWAAGAFRFKVQEHELSGVRAELDALIMQASALGPGEYKIRRS